MKTTTESVDLRSKFTAEFEMLESGMNGESKSYMHGIRRAAIEQFAALGFPTVRNEEWKYTNVQPLVSRPYALSQRMAALPHRSAVEQFLIGGLNAYVLVFVNGAFAESLSSLPEQQGRIVVGNFAAAQHAHSAIVHRHFAQYAEYSADAFAALNTAFSHDGAFVCVPDGQILDKPVQIVSIADARHGDVFAQPRHLVVLGRNSHARIVESSGTLGEHIGFQNAVAEVYVGEDSTAEFYRVQDSSARSVVVHTLSAFQEQRSAFTTVAATLDGEFVRNNVNIRLGGERAEAHLNGLYLPTGEQHVDSHTCVDHALPHCNSNELYKGVLDGNATGVFNGKVLVRPDAQKTNAFQSNRNVLLSASASINSKPQLEIFADDVKCSHGATIGQLDEDALFYLRARGLGEDRAKALLLYAFASDVLDTIALVPLREHLETRVAERLHKDF